MLYCLGVLRMAILRDNIHEPISGMGCKRCSPGSPQRPCGRTLWPSPRTYACDVALHGGIGPAVAELVPEPAYTFTAVWRRLRRLLQSSSSHEPVVVS
jgi:hypothetical protein